MKTLKSITNLMLLILCGIFMNNTNVLAQCNVEIGNNQGSFNGETDICLGENLSMTATVENGTPPYFYEWSNGEVVESIVVENLDYGEIIFSITVTDSEGCQTSDEVFITVNAIAVTVLNTTECSIMYSVYDDMNGNGSQDVDEMPIEGATANLLFPDGVTTITEVTNANGFAQFSDLSAGNYMVFIIYEECVNTQSINMSGCDNICNVIVNAGQDQQICADDITILTAFANGGEPPYTYQWSTGETTQSISVSPNENTTYGVTVTDMESCIVSDEVALEVSNMSLNLTTLPMPDCISAGTQTQIYSAVLGGNAPYFYQWSNGENDNIIFVTISESATYTLTVTDASGCQIVESISFEVEDCGECDLEANIAMEWSEPFCQTDTIVYSAFVSSNNTEPYTYLWTVDGIPVSTSQSFTLQVLQESYDIVLEVTDNNGCIAIDEKPLVGITCNYVWPGDANNDGIANNNDVLQIGLAYGTEGVERFEASTDWTAQPSTNWDTSFEDGLNHNFGDCDGNGTINDDDVAVVDLNYGQVHGKNEGENGTENDIPLFCELPENIVSGGSYSLPIKLGNDDISAADIYGIAFTISVTMEEEFELIEPQINFGNSWLGTQGFDMISLDKNVNLNQWDIALARTDQTDVSGSGQLCSIDCIMEVGSLKNETVLSIPVSVSFSNVTLINAQAIEILTNPITTQAEVISSIGAIENTLPEIAIYPNPATEILYIDNPNHEDLAITIMNVLGQNVVEQNISANENHSIIDISHLDSGYYLAKIEGQNEQKTYKLWID